MSLPWPDLTTEQWYEEIAKLKQDLHSTPDSSIINLGGPGSGNFGHVGRPGEIGGSGGGEGGGDRGGSSVSAIPLHHPTPESFIEARDKSTRMGFLSPLTVDDLKDQKLYLSKDGAVGGAMTKDGDMGNLFNNGGPQGAAREVLLQMLADGGQTADAFEGHLTHLYAQFGLKETGRMVFNPDYAPAGWNYEKDDHPDVVFLARTQTVEDTPDEIRTRLNDELQWTDPHEPGDKYYDDYDQAKRDATDAAARAAERRRAQNFGAVGESARGRVGHDEWQPHPARSASTGRGVNLGGPGSGNFGHSGRPGEIGGSGGDGGAAESIPAGKQGECFRNAAAFVREHDDFDLIHGKVTNGDGRTFDHAWAETAKVVADPTTGVKMDKDRWYDLVKAKPESKYSSTHATINAIRSRNHGPWTDEEVGTRKLRHDLGGEGSGNFGHAGRKGEVGGSAKGDTVGTKGITFTKEGSTYVGRKPDGGTLTAIPGEVPDKLRQEIFGDHKIEDVVGQMAEDLPGNLKASWSATISDNIIVSVHGADGLSMMRVFQREEGKLVVIHEVFEIPTSAQGKDLAKAVLADSMHTYKQLGVDSIRMIANLEVGGYAWAKLGFKVNDPDNMAETLDRHLTQTPTERRPDLEMALPNITPQERTGLRQLIDQHRNDPKLLWHVAGVTTADGRKIGKELLLGRSWHGSLSLDDPEAMTRFSHYVEGH